MSRERVSDEVDALLDISARLGDLVEQQVIANALSIHAFRQLSPAQLASIQRVIATQLERIGERP